MPGRFDMFAQGVGKVLSTTKGTRAHVAANAAKYGMAPKGSSKGVATAAYNAAVAKRQMEIGRRALVAGAVAPGAIALGSGSKKKSYYTPPRPTSMGSGRFA